MFVSSEQARCYCLNLFPELVRIFERVELEKAWRARAMRLQEATQQPNLTRFALLCSGITSSIVVAVLVVVCCPCFSHFVANNEIKLRFEISRNETVRSRTAAGVPLQESQPPSRVTHRVQTNEPFGGGKGWAGGRPREVFFRTPQLPPLIPAPSQENCAPVHTLDRYAGYRFSLTLPKYFIYKEPPSWP